MGTACGSAYVCQSVCILRLCVSVHVYLACIHVAEKVIVYLTCVNA